MTRLERATKSKRYRAHAENARASAEAATGEFRKSFLQVAGEYEEMAREAEPE
jgi:hypothetical protein